LEIGCGTGTNALWLADQGMEVLACDVSSVAIERARARAGERAGVRFERLDFLRDALPDAGRYQLAFDRGVLHVFDEPAERSEFARRVAQALVPGGLWACLAGSTEGPPRDHGPPRRSARDLILAMEAELEIVHLQAVMFTADVPSPAAGWWCIARRRQVPAQPGTRREQGFR
jgi:SAM-dependent methyltransferase